MKYKVGDEIRIIDPVPMIGGKWGKSGKLGIVVVVHPFKSSISDIWEIETQDEYHYDLDLWHSFAPDRVEREDSVPESIIEPR